MLLPISYGFESYRGKFPREEKTNFSWNFFTFPQRRFSHDEIYLQRKISHQKFLRNEHIFPTRS